jgi:hypothetical protein
MGEIKPSAEFSVFGHYALGIPLTLRFTKGSGNGKAEGANLETNGHGGTII